MSGNATIVERIRPEQTREFLAAINREAPWDTWAEKLAMRKRPEAIAKRLPKTNASPLEWSTSLDSEAATIQLVLWLSRMSRRRQKGEKPGDWTSVVGEWLETVRSRPACETLAIEYLAWANALPRLAVRLTDSTWAELFAELVNTAVDALAGVPRDDAEGMVESQLLAGELPMTMAYMFPKIELCLALGQRGCVVIDEGLLKVSDGEGLPHSDYVTVWRRLLACWTRCIAIDRYHKAARISPDARLQFEWFVRQTIRWRSGLANLPFEPRPVGARVLESLLSSALAVAGDRVDHELAEISRGRLKPEDSDYALPQPGEHSEWSELAIMRSSWARKSIHLAVDFSGRSIASALSVGPTPIWQGLCLPEIRVNTKRLEFVGEAEETCWSSDDDVDYLELELQLTGNWRFQRQFLIGRQDEILMMADVILGDRSAEIEYRFSLPVDSTIACQESGEHTEVQWMASKPIGWVLPLALSEWKSERKNGSFDGRVLRQNTTGKALYAPLFFDFGSKRRNKPVTWRQLTVAENLQLLPRDVAVAYRIQVGNRQWIAYRSLAPIGNRTFLGQNVMSEFLVGRLDKHGQVENLIEIE